MPRGPLEWTARLPAAASTKGVPAMKRTRRSVSVYGAMLLPLGIACLVPAELGAQSSPDRTGYRETSIFVETGVARLAVRDRAVSSERYSGSPDYIAVDWTRWPF